MNWKTSCWHGWVHSAPAILIVVLFLLGVLSQRCRSEAARSAPRVPTRPAAWRPLRDILQSRQSDPELDETEIGEIGPVPEMDLDRMLFNAVRENDLDQVKGLLERGVSVEVQNSQGATPLIAAAFSGHLEIVQFLISEGADVNARNPDGFSALHVAAQNGETETIQELAKSGAKINSWSRMGLTPLHMAAAWGRKEAVQKLLDLGANPSVTDMDGRSPLHFAAEDNLPSIVENLLQSGADVNAETSTNATPLHLINVNRNSGKVVEALLDAGAETGVMTTEIGTPLHWAAYYGNSENMELLVLGGSDPEARRKDGHRPFDVVCGCLKDVLQKSRFQCLSGVCDTEQQREGLRATLEGLARGTVTAHGVLMTGNKAPGVDNAVAEQMQNVFVPWIVCWMMVYLFLHG